MKTPRRLPLPACCAALFALGAVDAFAANSWIVTNCADDGSAGTLRYVISNQAQSGDTVDMTALQCSYISLATGSTAIAIPQANLTIQGPGVDRFPLDGNTVADSIFNHSGGGTLTINDLYLKHGNGHKLNPGGYAGGCVFSNGNAVLNRSRLQDCSVYSPSSLSGGFAEGGCVMTIGNLILSHSTLSGCIADAKAGTSKVYGGGAAVGGKLTAKYSQIIGNGAGFGDYGIYTRGGGAFVRGNVALYESTISYNFARYETGGLHVAATSPGGSVTITNSTFSYNDAPKVGGLYSNRPTTISNSTIAFNRKRAQSGLAAGATFSAKLGPISVNLHSTLLANNVFLHSYPTPPDGNDLGVANTGTYAVTFITDGNQGNYNLVRALDSSLTAAALPPDTIFGVCPLLGPLRYNGGETRTHALYSGSPAIDAGVNNLGLGADQRGGAFDRHSGVRTDIGAYEVQITDSVFDSSFDGCP